MKAIVFTGAGGNEVVAHEERPDPSAEARDLVVAVHYAGLNPADLAQRAGHYPAPPGSPADVPGIEVAGTVVATGAAVLGHAVGDRVFGLVGGGGLADRVLVDEAHVTAGSPSLRDPPPPALAGGIVPGPGAVLVPAGARAGGGRGALRGPSGGGGAAG